jgi:YD repeat-containing protein
VLPACGQLTSTQDPEGNVTDYFYFPESDPSGLADP